MENRKDGNLNQLNFFQKQTGIRVQIFHYILIIVIYFVITLPLIFKPVVSYFEAQDEINFHYPVILTFYHQFPHLDLINIKSATTPLFHLILAVSAFVVGPYIIQMRLINAILSLACVLILYCYLSKLGDLFLALFISLVFMISPYYIGSSVRLVTDNTALLFVLLSMYLIDIQPYNTQNYILTNIIILCAVLTRQINAWLIVTYLFFNLYSNRLNKSKNMVMFRAILPTLIPIVGLVYFLFLWKGFTPPLFKIQTSQTLNWDSPIFIVSLVGFYGSFFWYGYYRMLQKNRKIIYVFMILVALGALVLLLHPIPSDYRSSEPAIERLGMLWFAAYLLPNLFSTSIAIWFLFPLGLVFLFVMCKRLISNNQYLVVICFLLWSATSLINSRVYQRYYEPLVLFFIGYAIMTLKYEKRLIWTGPIFLLLGFIGLAVIRAL